MRRAEKRVSNVVEEGRTEEDEERMDDRGCDRREDKGEEGSLGLEKMITNVSIFCSKSISPPMCPESSYHGNQLGVSYHH